ncbi:hypothetical protein cyc_02158 [Cyclospora cayetanensis]|uniref:Uncharacterized protein n=1 Tax=Cyclospora cayetanensis TaxID=88456 RepID=A0A1D3D9Y4_9EIME|nr:hypothetical protein cyc_02158 [Cyclospora cayetanensis]
MGTSTTIGTPNVATATSVAHYQTSTTPDAVHVAHKVVTAQQGNEGGPFDGAAPAAGLGIPHADVEAAAGDEATESSSEGTTEATVVAGIRKLAETRLGYASDIGGQLQQTAQQMAAKKHPEEGKYTRHSSATSPKAVFTGSLRVEVYRHVALDASSANWYLHKRHTFIFSYSGKPVYSRYGKEENLGSFAGALSAIVSKLERFRGDKPPDVVRGAFEPLPLSSTMRHIACTAVKNSPTPNVLATMLLAEQRVVALSYAKGYELSPTGLFFLFCAQSSIRAFLHAYIRFLTPRVAFVSISSPADSIRFHELASHCNKLFAMLTNTGCLAAIETSLEYAPYALPRCLWGEVGLLHCSLYVPSLRQFFASAFGDAYAADSAKQQRFGLEFCLQDEKVYVWLAADFFFFCCVPRWIDMATALVEQLAKWIREQQPFLFITNIPPLVHTPVPK